jgi:hypothetical protein
MSYAQDSTPYSIANHELPFNNAHVGANRNCILLCQLRVLGLIMASRRAGDTYQVSPGVVAHLMKRLAIEPSNVGEFRSLYE